MAEQDQVGRPRRQDRHHAGDGERRAAGGSAPDPDPPDSVSEARAKAAEAERRLTEALGKRAAGDLDCAKRQARLAWRAARRAEQAAGGDGAPAGRMAEIRQQAMELMAQHPDSPGPPPGVAELIARLQADGPGWLRGSCTPSAFDQVISEASYRLAVKGASPGGLPEIRDPTAYLKEFVKYARLDVCRREFAGGHVPLPSEDLGSDRLADPGASDALDVGLRRVDGDRVIEVAQEAVRRLGPCPEHQVVQVDAKLRQRDAEVTEAALLIVGEFAGHGPGTGGAACLDSVLTDALAAVNPQRYGHDNRGAHNRRTVRACLLWQLQGVAKEAALPGLTALAHHGLLIELPRRMVQHVREHRARPDGPPWRRVDALLGWLEQEAARPSVASASGNGRDPVLGAVQRCPGVWIVANLSREIDQLDRCMADLEDLGARGCPHDEQFGEHVSALLLGVHSSRERLARRLEDLK